MEFTQLVGKRVQLHTMSGSFIGNVESTSEDTLTIREVQPDGADVKMFDITIRQSAILAVVEKVAQ
jgi:hypothetical protein